MVLYRLDPSRSLCSGPDLSEMPVNGSPVAIPMPSHRHTLSLSFNDNFNDDDDDDANNGFSGPG